MGRSKDSKNKIDKGIYLNCKVCDRVFRVIPARKDNALYCSASCRSKAIYNPNKFTMQGHICRIQAQLRASFAFEA